MSYRDFEEDALNKKFLALNERSYRVGETHHRAKLSDEQVDKIRDLHEDDGLGYRTLARMFDVSKSTIRDICRYDTRAQTPVTWRVIKGSDNGNG